MTINAARSTHSNVASHPPAVEVEGLVLTFGRNTILRQVDLSLPPGHIQALLGPSGCGKTTLLRIVAGLLEPTQGVVRVQGSVVADAATGGFVPPERRGLGMVFQDYALWPHLTIGGNVAFPLEMRGIGAGERRRRVAAALERVGLGGFEARSPASLSGGQQQRVAIARAIVAEPPLVLFDEPLSNLDKELRDQLSAELAALVRELGLSALYVTHDQGEAFAMADSVAIMCEGRIVQNAAPEELVGAPVDAGVAEFLNLGPVFRAVRRDGTWRLADAPLLLDFPPSDEARQETRQEMREEMREEADVLLARRALALTAPGEGACDGTIAAAVFRGDHYLATVRLDGNPGAADGHPVELAIVSEQRVRAGERAGVLIMPERLRWFAGTPVPH